jgi:hypothetical protein
MKKILAKATKVAASVASMGYFASAVAAQSASSYLNGISSAGSAGLLPFIKSALNTIIGLSALVAVGILVYSGIQYIMAAGDDGKIEKATKGITYAIIGLVICFISVLIVNFVLTNVLKA